MPQATGSTAFVVAAIILNLYAHAAPLEDFHGTQAGEERELDGVKLCWCPAGKFVMGSPRDEPERRPGENQVEVFLTRGFWIGKFEVTQGLWLWVMGWLPSVLDAGVGEDLPIYNVTFAEAEAFCSKLTEHLRDSGTLTTHWEFRFKRIQIDAYSSCAPKGQNMTAQGNALGNARTPWEKAPHVRSALQGRNKSVYH